TNLFSRVSSWLADAGNGIGDFIANRVRTKEICLSDDQGETCVTRGELNALVGGSTGLQNTGDNNPAPQQDVTPEPTPDPNQTPDPDITTPPSTDVTLPPQGGEDLNTNTGDPVFSSSDTNTQPTTEDSTPPAT